MSDKHEAARTKLTKDNDATAHARSKCEEVCVIHNGGGQANDNDGSVCFKVEIGNNFKLLTTMIENSYLGSSNSSWRDEKLSGHLMTNKTTKNRKFYACLMVSKSGGRGNLSEVNSTDVNNCGFAENSTNPTKSTMTHLKELWIRVFDDHGFKLHQKWLDELTYKSEMIDMLAKVHDVLENVNVLTVKPCWGWTATKQHFVNQFGAELSSLQDKHEKSCLEGVYYSQDAILSEFQTWKNCESIKPTSVRTFHPASEEQPMDLIFRAQVIKESVNQYAVDERNSRDLVGMKSKNLPGKTAREDFSILFFMRASKLVLKINYAVKIRPN